MVQSRNMTNKQVRKNKTAITKWEQTYTVPIPYFGLMEVRRDSGQGHYGNTEFTDTAWFWGSIEKVFEGIPIDVSVGIFGSIEYLDLSNRRAMYSDDITEERYNELKELAENNRSGMSVASYSGKVVIRDISVDSDYSASYYNYIVGTGRDYGGPDFGNFMSIEDAIDRVGEIVEQFFPKVMEYVNQEKMASTKKSKKGEKMANKKKIGKSINDLLSVYDNLSTEEKNRIQAGLDEIGTGFWVRNLLAGEYSPEPEEEYVDDDDDYYASTKKSMNKSKYSDIHKRLAKLGGFTKDEEEIEIDDDDVVEIEEEDGEKKVEIESKEDHEKEVENGEESDDDNLNECNRNVKSKKTSKGMRTSKKRMKMKKGEDMPEDADDFKEDNQKGSGSAGSDMPEDADDNQDINEKGSGNAGSELPEDADEQQDIKESARKTRKAMNRPPVRKFSVTNGGSPDQTSYNGRYQQAPMVRDAIDGHMSSRANKSFDEVAMMNERIANIQKAKRNPSGNNGVPKRIR